MTNILPHPSSRSAVSHFSDRLRAEGYVIIPGAVPTALVDALASDVAGRFDRTPFCEGLFYGSRTKRFGRLLARSGHAADFVQHKLIVAIVENLLLPHCDSIGLNLTQAIEVYPGSPAQVPHRDQDMWGGPKGEIEYLVNVMWPYSHYRADNGATLLWPGSHRNQSEIIMAQSDAVAAEMQPGDALLFLGSTLHGAGANLSNAARRGMIISYALGWLKPYENQWLAYPPDVAKHFSPELAALVGYCQHRPNLGNFEGRCPSLLLRDDVPEYLAAVDALRPDQELLIDAFLRGELDQAA